VFDEDSAVVQAVKAGDTEAFRHLVDRHKGRLFGVIVALVGDAARAEELVQDAFVKAYTGLAGFREDSSFGTWLVQIGIHATRDYIRWAGRQRGHNVISFDELRAGQRAEFEPPDDRRAADPSTGVEDREGGELLRAAMNELPMEYREVVVLRHLEGWSYEEIAELTGDTTGTLKVRAHRARRLLKDSLERLGWNAGAARPRKEWSNEQRSH
jgi:RNA polymerase sigma-70 factor (ECF subfamily)